MRGDWRVLAWGAVALLAGCGSSETVAPEETSATTTATAPVVTKPSPRVPASEYVGSKVCAECHSEVAEEFKTHPMGRSASLPGSDELEDYANATFQSGNLTYSIERKDGAVTHVEKAVDRTGEVLYEHRVPVAYAVGSGTHGRSYIVRRDQRLFMSPVAFYSNGRKWDLTPGYHKANRHFERLATDGCVNCHFGQPRPLPATGKSARVPDHFQDPAFGELTISCERCHGPGQQHVSYRRKPGATTELDPIVNPAKLEPRQRDSVCNQCHVQGVDRVPRYGREVYDFRPGDDLSDVWLVMLEGTRVDSGRTKAVSQVEQMASSTCAQASDGRLGCISCHGGHSVPREADKAAFYRGKCAKCHSEATADEARGLQSGCSVPLAKRTKENGNSCIACHMPPLASNNVPHTAQTDHRIRRNPKTPDLPPGKSAPFMVFDEAEKRVPQWELKRAYGLAMIRLARYSSDTRMAVMAAQILTETLAVAPDDAPALGALAMAEIIQDHPGTAGERWAKVLDVAPDDLTALSYLGFIRQKSGRLDEARQFFDRYRKWDRWDRRVESHYAQLLESQENIPESIKAAEEAVEKFPWDPAIHNFLSHLYELHGKGDQAQKHRRLAERLGAAESN